jgi:hypothetical protein
MTAGGIPPAVRIEMKMENWRSGWRAAPCGTVENQ